jgi:serine/threonine protein kinase
VKQAVHRATGLELAIKVYEKYKLMDTTKKKSVLKEINALMKLNHPNIMKLHDVIETPKQIYLVTEFVPGKMLSSYLRERMQSDRQEDESANTHQI